MTVVGVAVSRSRVRGVLVGPRGDVRWAATAEYEGVADLAEVVARLASECPPGARRIRVALDRDVAQLRTIDPAPRIPGRRVEGFAALQAPRLFRTQGAVLATDAEIVRAGRARALRIAAASEAVVEAIALGCAQTGLRLEALGPAADVLACALREVPRDGVTLLPNCACTEALEFRQGVLWRSRMIPGASDPAAALAPGLSALGADAPAYASAYGAAVGRCRLELFPATARMERRRASLRRVRSLVAAAAAFWLAAGIIFVGRVRSQHTMAERELARLAAPAESAMAERRDLGTARAAVQQLTAAERSRSRTLAVLGSLTAGLDDSTVIVSLRLGVDSTLRLAGYAPSAARVLAAVERAPGVLAPRFESPTTREAVTGTAGRSEWERFAVVARWRSPS